MQHKKQLFNLFEDICRLNDKVWNNIPGSYDDEQECAYPIEEALEGFNTLETLAKKLTGDEMCVETSPKEISRMIIDTAYGPGLSGDNDITDVDRFDKHLDIIYYSIGSLYKLGLSSEQIVDGLQVVHDANLQKSGAKDSNGKVTKDSTFIEPEEKLSKILDQRS